MTTQKLGDAAKADLRGKLIAIQSYLKKQGKYQIMLNLKQLEKRKITTTTTTKHNIHKRKKNH